LHFFAIREIFSEFKGGHGPTGPMVNTPMSIAIAWSGKNGKQKRQVNQAALSYFSDLP